MNYEKAYRKLFNAITDAINALYQSRVVAMELDIGIKILKEAQCETEEMYLAGEDE